MGLRTALRLTRDLPAGAVPAPAGSVAGSGTVPGIRSPWATGQLESIVWADLLDADLLPASRAEAMAVPAMARARHLLAGTIAGCPLVVYRGADRLPDVEQPAWTYRTDGPVSPWHRMAWTVDDLIFSGWSLWAVERGADSYPLAADRVPAEWWSFTPDRTGVLIDGTPPSDPGSVLLIPGPHEGLLTFAARTLRAASRLEKAAARHANNPVPSVELHQEVDVEIDAAERDELIATWVAARGSDTGAVGFTSYGIRAYPLGAVPEQLLIDGRNAAAVDVARHASIPAAMLDATSAGASLTYETTQGRNQQYVDYGVALYLDAIAARLSLDDVVPRGQRTGFDTSSLTEPAGPPPGGPATLD